MRSPEQSAPAAPGWPALALLCVAQFVDVLGVTVVVVALPSIGRELGFAGDDLQWVVSVYALLFGGCLLLAGRAADAFGARRLFVAGLAVFGAMSLSCGLAQSPLALVISRAVQGLGAAMVVPAALALLTAMYPQGRARDRALAVWTAAAAGGGAAGFVVGGLITASLGWEWVFLVNGPIALIAFALAFRLLPRARSVGRRGRLDAPGAVSVTAGLLVLIYGLTAAESVGVGSPLTLAAFAIGLVLIGCFVALESRVAEPLVPLAVFRRRRLVGANLTALALTGTTGAAAVLSTSYLQQVLDESAAATGFVFLPFSLCVIAGSAAAPALISRLGARSTVVSGLLGVSAAMLLFTRISTAGGVAYLAAGLALAGASLGCASVAATGTGTDQARAGEQGLVAGLLNTATQLGTAIGIAAFTTIAVASSDAVDADVHSASALVEGFRAAYLAAAVVAVGGAVVAAALMAPGGTRNRSSRRRAGRAARR